MVLIALMGALLMTADADVTDHSLRAALLDQARAPAVKALGKPVLFRVKRLRRDGDWAFLLADMEEAGGHPLNFAGTPLAEDARNGAVSRTYAALLHRQGDHWTIAANAVGPTDVAWEGWAGQFGAPSALFP